MSPAPSRLHDECTINLNRDGVETFHRFLGASWQRIEQRVDVPPDWEFAFGMMLGELLSNSARHAYCDTPENQRWLQIRLEADEACVRCDVIDRGQPFLEAQASIEVAVHTETWPGAESGRGLGIVAALADSFEYRRTPAGENIWHVEKCVSMDCSA
jgi:anti-sigma regulatory factor (Ser/Thr protein kinase)